MGPDAACHLPAIKAKATNMPMPNLDPTCPEVPPPTLNPQPQFRNKVKNKTTIIINFPVCTNS